MQRAWSRELTRDPVAASGAGVVVGQAKRAIEIAPAARQ
jgi:hypothetical protein